MNQSARRPRSEDRATDGRAPDGRAERGRQSRVKIAEAVLSLLDDGESSFPAERVAERAGVSRRLVFHHFADMSELVETAITRRLEQLIEQIRPLPTSGPRDTRVAALTEQRARILEWITPAQLTLMRLESPGAASPRSPARYWTWPGRGWPRSSRRSSNVCPPHAGPKCSTDWTR